MSAAFNRLGPRARDALARAILQAFRAGQNHARGRASQQMAPLHEYALNLVETALILDAAEAEAAGQDPH